jgi:hypothetical protein
MVMRFKLEELQEASAHYQGFCIACGAQRDSCEPDACNYDCDACGQDKVFGAEELMLMGMVS